MRAAVFLDRDGVLCENRSTYVKTWSEFQWIPGARKALRILARLGAPIVLVTNQSAINRGLTTTQQVWDLHLRMLHAIAADRGRLDAVYMCPHRPDEGCACRKPGSLLFHRAARDLGLSLPGSHLVGDGPADVEVGLELKLRVILVRTGLGEQTLAGLDGSAGRIRSARDLLEAARIIESDVRPDRAPRRSLWGRLPAARHPRVDAQRGGRT